MPSSLLWSPNEEFSEDQMQKDANSDERSYLLSIWSRLGVGEDGFLDRAELAQVCECVGMESLPEPVI